METPDVSASGSTGRPETEPETIPETVPESDPPLAAVSELLMIDDENIYNGMFRPYKDGYEPAVGNGVATVLLPLYASEGIAPDEIIAVPDLGGTENSPFIIRNYQKTIRPSMEQINGTQEEREVYLVRFDLDLAADRYNGVYPVMIAVDYTYQGISYSQSFTTYVHITDGQDPENENGVEVTMDTEEIPTSEPKVIISGCSGLSDTIHSGDEITMKVILENTSAIKSVQNMTVTVACEAEAISLEADSNVFYFDYLERESKMELPLTFSVSEGAASGKYGISLSLSYDNPEAVSLSSEGSIELNIAQKMDMALEIGQISEEINAGDSVMIPVQALNLGRGMVYNVRCSLDIPGLTASTSLFLGNMEGGSAASGEISAFAGIVNENAASDSERYGRTSGNVLLIYEDENGQEYTQTQTLTITVNPLVMNTASDLPEEEEANLGIQLAAGIGVLAVVVVAATAVPLVIHSKKRKRHENP